MNDEDRKMMIETHAFCKQNHKALHGNGKPGLIEDMARAKGALKATTIIGGALIAVLGVWVALK